MLDNMGTVERKVLGALLIMANQDNIAVTTIQRIADEIGYKKAGGALSFALKILERDNYIVQIDKRTYKLLV